MSQIKSYTDIEQSKKLAEILPLESADLHYSFDLDFEEIENIPTVTEEDDHFTLFSKDIPCWSLAALLSVMICPNLEEYIKGKWDMTVFTNSSLKTPIEVQDCKSAVDACYEMIIKLKELKLL